MTEKELIKKAKEVRTKAYAPYSKFLVGAALLTEKGKVYTGVNVENASYGLTVCAERVAVFKAVAGGERNFKKIVIVTDTDKPKSLCGACLQVLSEFASDLEIICATLKGDKARYRLRELLPKAFKRMSTER
ncbi:MAG: cytidine deaminase [candidate division Zixibacteria bacterium RBG_16_48_11]|nr:MAG: cytidine deaminase [candidate division Zixibacteria bacterium RBG_16_48_11]